MVWLKINQHTMELKYKVFYSFFSFFSIFFVSCCFHKYLFFSFIYRLLRIGYSFVFIEIGAGFFLFLKFNFFIAFVLTSPSLFYFIYLFILKGFDVNQIFLFNIICGVLICSILIFLFNLIFFVYPYIITFFLNFENQSSFIQTSFVAGSYNQLIFNFFIFNFFILFLIFLLVIFCPRRWIRVIFYSIFISFLFIITPPVFIIQLCLFLFFSLFFEFFCLMNCVLLYYWVHI